MGCRNWGARASEDMTHSKVIDRLHSQRSRSNVVCFLARFIYFQDPQACKHAHFSLFSASSMSLKFADFKIKRMGTKTKKLWVKKNIYKWLINYTNKDKRSSLGKGSKQCTQNMGGCNHNLVLASPPLPHPAVPFRDTRWEYLCPHRIAAWLQTSVCLSRSFFSSSCCNSLPSETISAHSK